MVLLFAVSEMTGEMPEWKSAASPKILRADMDKFHPCRF